MREREFEILMLKPSWSIRHLFFARSAGENKSSIINQLRNRYIRLGWHLDGDIGWGKENRFAVVKLRRPQTEPTFSRHQLAPY